jgi:hypothetical protein
MKKTPKDLASSPIFTALNGIVAVAALAGIASKSVPVAKASDMTYDQALQKNVGKSDVDMRTFTTTHTQSWPPLGVTGPYGNDDSKTTTDVY